MMNIAVATTVASPIHASISYSELRGSALLRRTPIPALSSTPSQTWSSPPDIASPEKRWPKPHDHRCCDTLEATKGPDDNRAVEVYAMRTFLGLTQRKRLRYDRTPARASHEAPAVVGPWHKAV